MSLRFAWDTQLSHRDVSEGPSFLHGTAFTPLSKPPGRLCVGLLLTLYSIPLIYMSIFLAIPHGLDYCNFIGSLQNQTIQSSSFVLFQN